MVEGRLEPRPDPELVRTVGPVTFFAPAANTLHDAQISVPPAHLAVEVRVVRGNVREVVRAFYCYFHSHTPLEAHPHV